MANVQGKLELFLSSPVAFDDGTRKVEVVKTHGAMIFLGNEDVYKIKRPVDLGYMDFSTLENRKTACEREIELNYNSAPSIYVRAVPITVTGDGNFDIDGTGEAVEWLVHMKRYPQDTVLLEVAKSGRLDQSLASNLGEKVASLHLDLPSLYCRNGGARVEDILQGVIDRLCDPALDLPKGISGKFKTGSMALQRKLSKKLDRRSRAGMVRHCHADMHLANIILLDGVPVPVDALEFDQSLAEIDVLYDIAFLLMDLQHLGLHRQANLVFNRYCMRAWPLVECDGFEVLPLFMALRAAIRSMVDAQRIALDETAVPDGNSDAVKYLNQALEFLDHAAPRLLAVSGLSGTGKSTLGAELALTSDNACGALILRSDLERKLMFETPEFEKLPPEAYGKHVSERVYAILLKKAATALSQGQSVVLDAVFADPDELKAATDLARDYNMPFTGFWLAAPQKVLVDRVRKRTHDASDADEAVVRSQVHKFAGIQQSLPDGWHEIDASGTREDTLQNALTLLK